MAASGPNAGVATADEQVSFAKPTYRSACNRGGHRDSSQHRKAVPAFAHEFQREIAAQRMAEHDATPDRLAANEADYERNRAARSNLCATATFDGRRESDAWAASQLLPARIGIEAGHGAGALGAVGTEILLIDDAVLVDDEGHNAGGAVARGKRHQPPIMRP
jgi:hypothetical protein